MYIQVQMKEVLIEEADVSKAMLEYISRNYINSMVVGASTRNAITRFSLILHPFFITVYI